MSTHDILGQSNKGKEALESWYKDRDPWGYETLPCDALRKRHIIHTANLYGPYSRALDVGAGEGFITRDLPASTRHGYELSDAAAARFPPNVKRELEGKYDLVLCSGCLYSHYDWLGMLRIIKFHASKIIITSHIKAWELSTAIQGMPGAEVFQAEFPYREWTQRLRVFKV